MLVGTESKEGHNELIEEILTRMEVNDLYVKPKKYKWKMREVGFLEVVMRFKLMISLGSFCFQDKQLKPDSTKYLFS